MSKVAASWAKPVSAPGLIGRKQIDWSFFKWGTTIPGEFREGFRLANGGYQLSPAQRRGLTLIVSGNEYRALLWARASDGLLQIRYDSNAELRHLFEQSFQASYQYLSARRERRKRDGARKVFERVPAARAEHADFYATGVPFRYRVELSAREDDSASFVRILHELRERLGEETDLPIVTQGTTGRVNLYPDGSFEAVDGGEPGRTDPSVLKDMWLELLDRGYLNLKPDASPSLIVAFSLLAQLPRLELVRARRLSLFLTDRCLSNGAISNIYGVRAEGGIRYAGKAKSPVAAVFITDPSSADKTHPYTDKWQGGSFWYCGEGRKGPQQMLRGNLALKALMESPTPLHGFRKQKANQYEFMGTFRVLGVRKEVQPDSNNKRRRVYVFRLEPVAPSLDLKTGIPSAGGGLGPVSRSIADNFRQCSMVLGHRHEEVLQSLVASLTTKRFALLVGPPEAGKTQTAMHLGQWFGEGRYLTVSVRPDWTCSVSLLGHTNASKEGNQGPPSWHVPEPLAFMLRAASDPTHPYLLIFDEMNQADPESYASAILSGVETGDPCLPNLHPQGELWVTDDELSLIAVPSNLFIIGTVDLTETLHDFPMKFLSRANALELRVTTDDLSIEARRPSNCPPGSQELVKRFLETSRVVEPLRNHEDAINIFARNLRIVHSLLQEGRFEFGQKTFSEAVRFAHMFFDAGQEDPFKALDLQVLQRILPRLQGTKKQLEPTLSALGQFCHEGKGEQKSLGRGARPFEPLQHSPADSRLPRSFERICRMTKSLRKEGFARFLG